jgi:Ca-activated chloride channel family protein
MIDRPRSTGGDDGPGRLGQTALQPGPLVDDLALGVEDGDEIGVLEHTQGVLLVFHSEHGGKLPDVARRAIEIVAADVTLAAPDKAVAGAAVAITWTGPNNQNDYLTIVPKGAPDGSRGAITYTTQGSPLKVTAPSEVGAGEIRYMRGLDDQVLARCALEIVVANVTLAAPEQVVAGAAVAITWTGPNNQNDYLTIVPQGAPDGSRGAIACTTQGSPLEVTAPGEAGAGEIRYLRGLDDQVLARRTLKIIAARITLKAPAKAPLGAPVLVEWTGPNNHNDYLTIVPQGAPDGASQHYAWTASGSPARIDPPDAAGPCEVRYVSGQNDKVLARLPIEITAAGTGP